MPIDVSSVLGAHLEERSGSWGPTDVILYHLGLGAGVPPTDSAELKYVYEERLHVLPSFGVIPASPMLFDMLRLPGMDVDLSKLLHGEQQLGFTNPCPSKATSEHRQGSAKSWTRARRRWWCSRR